MTKAECEQTARFLGQNNFKADFYHAGQSKTDRKMVQNAWLRGDVKVLMKLTHSLSSYLASCLIQLGAKCVSHSHFLSFFLLPSLSPFLLFQLSVFP
jgi:hypothetical protein